MKTSDAGDSRDGERPRRCMGDGTGCTRTPLSAQASGCARLQESRLLGLWRQDARVLEQQLVERGGAALHLSQDEKARQAERGAALAPARVETGQPRAAEARVGLK
eukprot:1663059-Pleurochrysis_carterae.AAC.2